ncbi:Iron-sulfur cluster carrier protein [Geodia barretti]|uniref:Iron-sulfur cluster carrier protein n=1 Tax=Geodia barretti TaxID=519541 RepID=A0AA35X6X7_GEOBA|nr:Iron-sulfur cluster carrier protein [Geodia barretti]
MLNAPVIGIVENMAAYVCTDCGKTERPVPIGHTEEMARQFDILLLGKIPSIRGYSIAAADDDEGSVFVDSVRRDTPRRTTFLRHYDDVEIRTFFE